MRLLDVTAGVILGGLSLITIPILYPLIRPLFFTQKRVGKNGAVFTVYKIRTMTNGVITPVGRLLRRSRIDELPQALNLLTGEMSLIGPRPETIELTQKYTAEIYGYGDRLAVKPGITGLAQVRIGYCSTVKETKNKLGLDLYYIDNKSLLLDLQILYYTIGVVLRLEGK